MSDRMLYISRNCPHCKKLLIGIHKYEFLRPHFNIIDVQTQQYPNYIQSVPTLVIGQNMIKADDVFGYMNNMVEQVFTQNPELKQKYHPQQRAPQQRAPQQGAPPGAQQSIGQKPVKAEKGPSHDPIDDLIGWCPDGGCSFAPISESNDDCSKANVSLEDTRFSFIGDDSQVPVDTAQKIPLETDNSMYQKNEKQKKMDESYERLMAERNLLR